MLRGYWSAVLLGLAAVVLLAVGAPSKAALAGAGFAFIGAAVTRGIDLAKERRADAARADADRRRDLDETRRLACMALYAADSRAPELVAALVNALAHACGNARSRGNGERTVRTATGGRPGGRAAAPRAATSTRSGYQNHWSSESTTKR